jgi:nitrile hydratase subunit beta
MDEIVTLPAVDGVHDLGGMHGFGAVPIETGEPIFHALWEGRVWALLGAVMPATTIDRFRWTIEQMPPAEYLNSAYYARWLWAIERLANEQGLLTGSAAPARIARPEPSSRPASARWQRGQRVRVLSRVSAGHTRVPRYLRRHVGTVERAAFSWPSPAESAATGRYGNAEVVYTVAFAAADLFGPDHDHTVTADLGESDLEDNVT